MASSLSTFTMIAAVPPTAATTARSLNRTVALGRTTTTTATANTCSKSPKHYVSCHKSSTVPFAVSTTKAAAVCSPNGGDAVTLAIPQLPVLGKKDEGADSAGGDADIIILPFGSFFGKKKGERVNSADDIPLPPLLVFGKKDEATLVPPFYIFGKKDEATLVPPFYIFGKRAEAENP